MTQFLLRIAALALGLAPSPALSETDSQLWLTFSARADVAGTLWLQADNSTRFSDAAGGLYQVLNSVMIGHSIADGTVAWAGYAVSPSYAHGVLADTEHRLRGQLSLADMGRLGVAQLSGRVLIEQRWRDAQPGSAARVRPQLRLSLPLGGGAAPRLNLSGEVYLNIDRAPFQTVRGLERTRTSAVVTVPISRAIAFDIGMIHQHRFDPARADTGEYALTTGLNLSL